MPTVEVSIPIAARPEAVARVLLDAELAPAWTADLEWLEFVEGEPGQPGCVGRAHYLTDGRRHTLTDTLLEVDPNRRYRSRVTGSGMAATIETRLEPTSAGGTQLHLRWTGKGTNPLTKPLLALSRRRILERIRCDLDSLRRLVESSPDRR